MTYLIAVVPVDSSDPRFTYEASTHPTLGEQLYVRDKHYKVVSVGHVLTTRVIGNYQKHTLEEVEIIVVKA